MPNQVIESQVMSVKNIRALRDLFAKKMEDIEKEVYPLSDPSILKGRVNEQLEILDQILSDLKTQINDEMKKYNDLKGKPAKIFNDTNSNVGRSIQAYINEFRRKISGIEKSLVGAGQIFAGEYEYKIQQWGDDFIDKINKIDNRLLDEKFKFNGKEHSLKEVVESYEWYLYVGIKKEHYLTMGQIGQAII